MKHASALVVLTLLPTGCWREQLGEAPPVVLRLDASPAALPLGEQVVVSWEVDGADQARLADADRAWEELDPKGALVLLPDKLGVHELTLEAVGPGGRAEETVSFDVLDATPESRPKIHLFLAEPSEIDPGGQATLRWRVDRATRVRLLSGEEEPRVLDEPTGEQTVQPERTTVYTLEAEGPGGASTKEARVVVRNPEIVLFVADRDELHAGEAITLTWQTRFAQQVTIDPPVAEGALPADTGSVVVTPDAGEHTWTLTASGLGPDATADVGALVYAVPAVTRFEVQPTEALPGDLVRLFWETTGADSVTITPSPSGEVLEVERPNQLDGHILVAERTTTFSLVAHGVGGDSEPAEAELTVHRRPAVDRFVADPNEIPVGGTAQLSWETTDATSVVIDPPVSEDALPLDGAAAVRPDIDTEYRLTATGPGGDAPASVTVRVHPPPTIDRLEASVAEVPAGGAVTLSWETTGATAVTLDPAPALGLPPDRLDGSVVVRPEEDTTWTLSATGPGGAASADVHVAVLPRPRIVSFVAAPDAVPMGGTVTLTWVTENADSVAIEPAAGGGGPLPVSGSVEATPQGSGNYTLTATSRGGQVTANAWVVVIPEPTIETLTVDPATVAVGASATLSWHVRGALRVWFDPGPGIIEDEYLGSRQVQPDGTTEYVLHAMNGGGERTASVTLTVDQPPRVLRFEPDPATIIIGATTRLYWELADADELQVSVTGGAALDLGAEAVDGGSVEVAPLQTTSYTLTASGPGGDLAEAASATVTVTAAGLVLSEVMFDPIDGSDSGWQWIELYNPNGVTVPLGSYAIGIGGYDWKRPAFQLDGSLEAGGCFVVGGASAGEENGSPAYDQVRSFDPQIDDEPTTASVVGIFFASFRTFGNWDLSLVPRDAVLFGYANRTAPPGGGVVYFLGPDGQPLPVHALLYELDDHGYILRVGGRPVRTYELGQSLTRSSPAADDWAFAAPSPGVCFDELRLTSVEPPEAPNVEGVEVVVRGGGFSAGTEFRFGGVVPQCELTRVDEARCTLPARAGGPSFVGVTASAGAAQATLPAGYAFTGLADDVEWCQIQLPLEAVEVESGAETEPLFGRVYDAGTTPGEGQGGGLVAQVGLGPDGSDPQVSAAWRWTDGVYNGDLVDPGGQPADDEYRATLSPEVAGEYDWAWRFSYDGLHWLYCDGPPGHGPGGAEAAGAYDPADAGALVVH